MAWTFQSRKKGNKKWATHIPYQQRRETVERRLADLKLHGKLDSSQEYRIVQYPSKQRS